ncbi:MAG: ATP--guanido phosphotransferase, partial [Clostridia bacterium]|nr:ATP--guanido phosphotransferase [Clostridia bacterium]
LIKKKGIGAAFISTDKSMSVMVNEEDHLREQYIYKGFDLYKAYEQISGVDDALGGALGFAYDARLGYLTACPSNLGTGMRASVMMFLPGLAWSKELEEFLPTLKAGGLTVRGVFGEGTAAQGYSYQVSNERTLGVSEGEILDKMIRMTMTICDLELRARERMLKENEISLRDMCLRAYGTLTNCAVLSLKELTSGIVKVKLGVALGFFKARDMQAFNDFVANMRPASFRLENGLQRKSEEERNLIRADIVHKVLPELVSRAD